MIKVYFSPIAISLIFIMLTTSFVYAQPDPAPPVGISGANTAEYEPHRSTFGDGGWVLLQLWVHTFEASDATYVYKQTHMVINPTKSGDIEDVQWTMSGPGGDCEIIQMMPQLNSSGITLAGSINVDSNPGVNIGGEMTIGVDGSEVEVAGPDAFTPGAGLENADWTIDFDDFSTTAESRVFLDFYAAWRCPKDGDGPHLISNSGDLCFEIDEWGWWDPAYYMSQISEDAPIGEEWILLEGRTPVPQQTAQIDELGMGAAVDHYPGMAVASRTIPLRARAYGDDLSGITARMSILDSEQAPVVMDSVRSGKFLGQNFVEFRARLPVPEQQQLTPLAMIDFGNNESRMVKGVPIPIVTKLQAEEELQLQPGRNAIQLTGEVGSTYQLSLSDSIAFKSSPKLYAKLGGDVYADVEFPFTWTYENPDAVLALNLPKSQEASITLKALSTADISKRQNMWVYLLIGGIVGLLVCYFIRKLFVSK